MERRNAAEIIKDSESEADTEGDAPAEGGDNEDNQGMDSMGDQNTSSQDKIELK